MANIKISELTALTPPDAADLVPVTDSSASQTKRTTVGEIVGIINGDVDVANDGTATISELPVSKLADGTARQLLQTDAAGTGVEWTSNVDVPGTLDVTGAATLDSTLDVTGLISADGKVSFPLGTADAPSLYPGTDADTGLYSPGPDELALATNGAQALYINSNGDILVADGNRMEIDEIRARDGAGLKLFDDGGAGIFIEDGGNVLVGTSSGNGTGNLQVQGSRRLRTGGGRGWVEVVGRQSGIASGTVVDLATLTLDSVFDLGSYVRLEVFAGVRNLLNGYTMAFSVREALVSCRSSTSRILVNTEDKNLQGSINSGTGNITLATSIVASSAPSFTLRATPTITGSGAGAETATLTYRLSVLEGGESCTITNLLTS